MLPVTGWTIVSYGATAEAGMLLRCSRRERKMDYGMDRPRQSSSLIVAIRIIAVVIGALALWLLIEFFPTVLKDFHPVNSPVHFTFQMSFNAVCLFVIGWFLFVAWGGVRQLTDGSIHRLCGAATLVLWSVTLLAIQKLNLISEGSQPASWFTATCNIGLLIAAAASLGMSRFLMSRVILVDEAAKASHKRAVERWLGLTTFLLWGSLPFTIMSHMHGRRRSLPDEPWDLVIPIGSAVVAWIIYKLGVKALSFPVSVQKCEQITQLARQSVQT